MFDDLYNLVVETSLPLRERESTATETTEQEITNREEKICEGETE